MKLYLYKVVANYGMEAVLDSMLYCQLCSAIKSAENWLKDENCDSVNIYYEEAQKDGYFRTINLVKRMKREGE